MTAFSCRPSLAAVVLAPRIKFRRNVIGRPTWTARFVAARVQVSHRGRPDLLFEEAATAREMYRL